MFRIIDGILLEGKRADAWTVSIRHLGNGHAEASARRAIHWEEVGPVAPEALPPPESPEDAADRLLANKRRAARRAKTMVRHRIKAAGLDALLTLTYRENQTDQALAKKHLQEFVRRIRRVLPGFSYVAAYEPQKRGAWHIHMAMHRLPKELPASNGVKVKSYNVVRAIWRSVTGELGGNIDQQARKRWSKQTSGKLAAYLSKYMMKAFEDGDAWSNRYSASQGINIPKATILEFRQYGLNDLVELLFGEIADGNCICTTWLSDFKDCFFLSTERPPG